MHEDPLSPVQVTAFGVVMIISSSLSLLGSMLIIHMIVVNEKLGTSMFYRIMMGLCIADILVVLKILLTPILLPRETGLALALGNFASCDVIAFWSAIHVTFFLFNLYLSCFYLMIAYEIEYICAKLEIPAYLFATVFPAAIAIFTVTSQSGAPNPLSRTCSYGSWPVECSQLTTESSFCTLRWDRECEMNCTRNGQLARELGIVFYVMVGLSVVLGILATFMIYWKYLQSKRKAMIDSVTPAIEDRPTKRLKELATQARYFCLAYTNTSVWLFLLLVFDPTQTTTSSSMGPGQYALLLLIYLLLPIQGFFNAMVFVRQRWKKWRKATRQDHRSVWYVFQKVCFTTEKPPSSSSASRARGGAPVNAKTLLKQTTNIASQGAHDSEEQRIDYRSKVHSVMSAEDDSSDDEAGTL